MTVLRPFSVLKGSWTIALVLLVTFVITGCAELRKVTYPADFKYLERSDVRSTMAEFGRRIWEMDGILADSTRALTERERVLEILDELESYAQSINPGGRPTNHLVIDSHIQQFIDSVKSARAAVDSNPPSFYRAGQLSGSCMACHIHR